MVNFCLQLFDRVSIHNINSVVNVAAEVQLRICWQGFLLSSVHVCIHGESS